MSRPKTGTSANGVPLRGAAWPRHSELAGVVVLELRGASARIPVTIPVAVISAKLMLAVSHVTIGSVLRRPVPVSLTAIQRGALRTVPGGAFGSSGVITF